MKDHKWNKTNYNYMNSKYFEFVCCGCGSIVYGTDVLNIENSKLYGKTEMLVVMRISSETGEFPMAMLKIFADCDLQSIINIIQS